MIEPFDASFARIHWPNRDRDKAVDRALELVSERLAEHGWRDYSEADGDVVGLSVLLASSERSRADYRKHAWAVQDALTRLRAAGWDRAEYDFDTGSLKLERHRKVLTVWSAGMSYRVGIEGDAAKHARRIGHEGVFVPTSRGMAYLPPHSVHSVTMPEGYGGPEG